MAEDIAYCLVAKTSERFFGLSASERLRRGLVRRGVTQQVNLGDSGYWPGPMLLWRADHVVDDSLVGGLVGAPGAALTSGDASGAVIGVHSVGPADRDQAIALIEARPMAEAPGIRVLGPAALADGSLEKALRKRANPLILKISDWSSAEIEQKLFTASYKGVTDFVTKHVWPWPALRMTRYCVHQGITPNQVTAASALLVVLAFWLFLEGWFLPGLVAAWGMCFLDTVDGKLARVTLASGKWGNVFDHGIDLVHPPFWYWAWATGLGSAGAGLDWALWVVIGGYLIGRLQEGWFLWRYEFEIHAWRPLDSWVRQITARRNPNLAILTVAILLSAPGAGLAAVALWTLASLGFHFARIGQAEIAAGLGTRPHSWLANQPAATGSKA